MDYIQMASSSYRFVKRTDGPSANATKSLINPDGQNIQLALLFIFS